MPSEQSIPPGVPRKPLRVSRWLVAAGVVFALLYVVVSMIHLTGGPPPEKQKQEQQATLPSSGDLSHFKQMTADDVQQLAKKRAILQQERVAAGLDESVFADIVNHLPACNSEERQKLNGQNYRAVNQLSGQQVAFACQTDDSWHPLPAAVNEIQPLTAQQQERSLQLQGRQSTRVQGDGMSAKEKRAKALEASLHSSAVVDFAAAASEAASEVKAVPVADVKPAPGAHESKPEAAWDTYTGSLYEVFEGTVLEGILTNRLAGEYTGPVNVMVTTNLYSHDRQHILMPQGTRILGESQRVSLTGQQRLAVTFHRALMPDGWSKNFDDYQGLNQQGAAGLNGRVDTHWPQAIATAALVGGIGGLAQIGGTSVGYGGWTAIRNGVSQQSGQEATQILDRLLNKLPTVTVFEGSRVRIWVRHDFQLPSYDNHTVSPTL